MGVILEVGPLADQIDQTAHRTNACAPVTFSV
jgi:hypothetical protein